MPFTVSHAAAVLPLRRMKLVWSAFIVGSMAPDFPYIVGSVDYREIGHRFPGVLFFTIPASLVALWLFHNFVKQPICLLLPAGVQVRLRRELGYFPFVPASRFARILLSIVLGIASHLVWDSFTHPFTWAFYHVPGLDGWVHLPILGAMPTHAALQYVSSLLGLIALAIWVLLWYRRTSPATPLLERESPRSRFGLAIAMFAVAGTAGLVRAFILIGRPATGHNADKFMLVVGVTAMALAFWELVLYCLLVATYQVWML